ncbi:hypothetical protein Aph02nite_22290 [Actinoplanes philippinensis]|nr:hypothetical protein Aph02nite_22290 [Actinoplanes philippinensis]
MFGCACVRRVPSPHRANAREHAPRISTPPHYPRCPLTPLGGCWPLTLGGPAFNDGVPRSPLSPVLPFPQARSPLPQDDDASRQRNSGAATLRDDKTADGEATAWWDDQAAGGAAAKRHSNDTARQRSDQTAKGPGSNGDETAEPPANEATERPGSRRQGRGSPANEAQR